MLAIVTLNQARAELTVAEKVVRDNPVKDNGKEEVLVQARKNLDEARKNGAGKDVEDRWNELAKATEAADEAMCKPKKEAEAVRRAAYCVVAVRDKDMVEKLKEINASRELGSLELAKRAMDDAAVGKPQLVFIIDSLSFKFIYDLSSYILQVEKD